MATDPVLLKQRAQEVAKMPQLERDRLQRAQAEFAKMTEAKRTHYRELQKQLDDDRAIGGSLTNLLHTYSAWLQTLTPGQREELSRETDSAKKLELVRKFKDEQDHPAQTTGTEMPEITADGFPGRFASGNAPMSPQDLRSVMKVLVDELTAEDKSRLEKADRAEQFWEIVRLNIRQSPDGPRDWPSHELQGRMMNAIESRSQRDFIKKRPADAQRDVLVRHVLFAILNQAADESKSKWPHRSDLEQVFRELDQETKRDLLQRPQREMNNELVRRYFEKRSDNTLRNLMDLKDQLVHEIGRLGLRQHPPQDHGPGFGPNRGPGEGRGSGRDRDNSPRPGDRPPPPPPRGGAPFNDGPPGGGPSGGRPPND
jgi:hypothetical protein